MRSYLPAYDLKVPADLAEALYLLECSPGDWTPFAGGTDLMVLLEFGRLNPGRFLSLWHLRELRGIEESPTHVVLGALTTYTHVLQSEVLRKEFPLLCQAARETGAVAIQNRGTLGGNIANASPAADSPPALLVYDAELELVSANQRRWVPYRDFHTGYKKTLMKPEELIARVRLPRSTRPYRQFFRKVGTRRAQAISKVCFAGLADSTAGRIREIRIALGSMAPIPLRCSRTEDLLRERTLDAATIGTAIGALSEELMPIDDFRSTAAYRLQVARNLLEEFLRDLGNERL
jgi:CO/xanthine dehydrogenase FAD-binding subunit